MYNISDIKNYILFLKNKCGLSITLHPINNEALIMASELMLFNIHDNSHCIYIKTFPEAQRHCVERQEKILEKCRGGAFCGTCYAGVREYVYPIIKNGDSIGFICVSGYTSQKGNQYLEKVSRDFSIPLENLKKTYHSLKSEMPEKEEIDTLILPLLSMLELAYIKAGGDDEPKHPIEQMLRYIRQHRAEDITIDDLCAEFSCSRSYISHFFKRYTGKSFREYLTELRINDAKSLLVHSRLSITEIAFSVGFKDSNYFSNVFKKNLGASPRSFRNKA